MQVPPFLLETKRFLHLTELFLVSQKCRHKNTGSCGTNLDKPDCLDLGSM